MSENSKIEWTDHTFNPFIGCTKVSPGCDNCYAEHMMDTRMHRVKWGPGQPRARTSAANWREPVRWNARHEEFFAAHGRRQRVFCASLADVFDNAVPAAWRRDLAALIEATPALDWQLLTKRIGNAAAMLVDMFPAGTPDHVWLGATVVNQTEADRDVPKLLATPARMRFLSIEPMLGPVDVARWLDPTGVHCMDVCADTRYVKAGEVETYNADGESVPLCPACGESASWTGYDDGIDWVIAGGESGPVARPAHPDWFRSLRDQCAEASVPFLFKQWGEWHTGARLIGSGEPVFRQFGSHQQWVNKATTWVNGGICLDRHGSELRNGGDFMRARDNGLFPVTIMHRVGKRAAGRLLDGVEHNGFPEVSR
ncbi:phage Gp37/Gp68 family protein [Burkholderia gladioli]|uniref:phage Gp37/Gp68 family protein n=1 Tax=Burkholderia gladioli TaxID=28095 RepID=UPI001C280C1C|nr:phage Gp37/Gp68 family protein [Burkholderia gladioli]